MNTLSETVDFLYTYCTDFIIHLANLSGTSYYEVNLLIFAVLYPLATLILGLLLVLQKRKLANLH